MGLIKTAIASVFMFAFCCLSAQQPAWHSVSAIYLSKIDSAILQYEYPVFTGIENKTYEERLNKQIAGLVIPDSTVLLKLELLKQMPAGKPADLQSIRVDVTYMDETMVCLQTRIREVSNSMPGATGDLYFDTYSIASGNEYYLNNLFTAAIDEIVFKKYEDLLISAKTDWEHFKQHVVGFGLISDGEKKTLTLEILVNTLYSQEGPMPLELTQEEFTPYLNQNGPLYKALNKTN